MRVTLHDLSTEEMLAGLREKKLHVALTVHPPKKLLRDLNFETGALCIGVAVAPKHPLAKLKSISPNRWRANRLWPTPARITPNTTRSWKRCSRPSDPPHIGGEHDGVSSMIAAVEAGRGGLVSQAVSQAWSGHA